MTEVEQLILTYVGAYMCILSIILIRTRAYNLHITPSIIIFMFAINFIIKRYAPIELFMYVHTFFVILAIICSYAVYHIADNRNPVNYKRYNIIPIVIGVAFVAMDAFRYITQLGDAFLILHALFVVILTTFLIFAPLYMINRQRKGKDTKLKHFIF